VPAGRYGNFLSYLKKEVSRDRARARRSVALARSGSATIIRGWSKYGHVLQYPDYFFRKELRDAYALFIHNLCRWDWFCTMTWRDLVHPESALKFFKVFVNRLNTKIWGRHYYRHDTLGVFCCIAIEKQLRQVLHIHTLICGVPMNISYTDFALWWQRRQGSCEITPYDSNRDAGQYLSKYVAKDSEIEFYGNTKMVDYYEVPDFLFR
jgi:hypothetical protein